MSRAPAGSAPATMNPTREGAGVAIQHTPGIGPEGIVAGPAERVT